MTIHLENEELEKRIPDMSDTLYSIATDEDNWHILNADLQQVLIERKIVDGSSTLPFYRASTYIDAPVSVVSDYLWSLDNWSKIDPSCIESKSKTVEIINDHSQLAVWANPIPAPFVSDRFFIAYRAKHQRANGTVTTPCVSVKHPDLVPPKGTALGEVQLCGFVLVPDGEEGVSCRCRAYFLAQMDLCGSIPGMVVSHVITRFVMCVGALRDLVHLHYTATADTQNEKDDLMRLCESMKKTCEKLREVTWTALTVSEEQYRMLPTFAQQVKVFHYEEEPQAFIKAELNLANTTTQFVVDVLWLAFQRKNWERSCYSAETVMEIQADVAQIVHVKVGDPWETNREKLDYCLLRYKFALDDSNSSVAILEFSPQLEYVSIASNRTRIKKPLQVFLIETEQNGQMVKISLLTSVASIPSSHTNTFSSVPALASIFESGMEMLSQAGAKVSLSLVTKEFDRDVLSCIQTVTCIGTLCSINSHHSTKKSGWWDTEGDDAVDDVDVRAITNAEEKCTFQLEVNIGSDERDNMEMNSAIKIEVRACSAADLRESHVAGVAVPDYTAYVIQFLCIPNEETIEEVSELNQLMKLCSDEDPDLSFAARFVTIDDGPRIHIWVFIGMDNEDDGIYQLFKELGFDMGVVNLLTVDFETHLKFDEYFDGSNQQTAMDAISSCKLKANLEMCTSWTQARVVNPSLTLLRFFRNMKLSMSTADAKSAINHVVNSSSPESNQGIFWRKMKAIGLLNAEAARKVSTDHLKSSLSKLEVMTLCELCRVVKSFEKVTLFHRMLVITGKPSPSPIPLTKLVDIEKLQKYDS